MATRDVEVLAITPVAAESLSRIAAVDPRVRVVDARGWFDVEIAETGEKLGIVRHQSNSEPRDRVDRLRRLIVPGPVRRDDAKG